MIVHEYVHNIRLLQFKIFQSFLLLNYVLVWLLNKNVLVTIVSSVDVGTDIGFLQMVDYMYVIFYIVEFSKNIMIFYGFL